MSFFKKCLEVVKSLFASKKAIIETVFDAVIQQIKDQSAQLGMDLMQIAVEAALEAIKAQLRGDDAKAYAANVIEEKLGAKLGLLSQTILDTIRQNAYAYLKKNGTLDAVASPECCAD